ncbi:MAG: hypothetical protein H5T86_13275 [Armatimonadetes bacterium]|nr:hypothetical protein [Armatimonadota bacterium]
MAQSERFERAIGIAIEDTWGQAPATPTITWVEADGQLKTEREDEPADPALGIYDELHIVPHGSKVTGTLRIKIGPGRESVLVDLLSRVSGSKRYLKSATVWENYDQENNLAFQSVGVCVNRATLNTEKGGELIAELECIGKQRSLVTWQTMTVAQIPEYAYTFEELLVTFNGQYVVSAQAAQITIDHKLRDDRYGADRTGLLRHLPSQGRSVRIRVPREFDDNTFHTAFENRSEGTLVIDWRRTVGTTTYYLTATMNRVVVLSCDPEDEDQPIELAALAPAPDQEAIVWSHGTA